MIIYSTLVEKETPTSETKAQKIVYHSEETNSF